MSRWRLVAGVGVVAVLALTLIVLSVRGGSPSVSSTTTTLMAALDDHRHDLAAIFDHHRRIHDGDHQRRTTTGRGRSPTPRPVVRLVRRDLPEGPRRPLASRGDNNVSRRWRGGDGNDGVSRRTRTEQTSSIDDSGSSARSTGLPRRQPDVDVSAFRGRWHDHSERLRPMAGRPARVPIRDRLAVHPNDLWLQDCDDLDARGDSMKRAALPFCCCS